MSDQKENFVILGKITSPFGLQGWVKVYSYTDPMDGIFQHKTWSLWRDGKPVGEFALGKGQQHSKGLIARLKSVENRNQSEALAGTEIRIYKDQLPDLEEGDYYWHQLVGLTVMTVNGVNLGRVDYLMDTGANDVLVIKGTEDSKDNEERLLPYLVDQVVKEVDLSAGTMLVDWDPDF